MLATRPALPSAPARTPSLTLGRRIGVAGRTVRLQERELFAHTLLLGTTGSGKTTAALTLLTQALEAGWGVVSIDLKGDPDVCAALAGAAADAQAPYRQFSFTPGERCDRWQPLASGDPAARMSRVICLSEWSEPYYRTACERFAQLVFVLLERVGVEPDFPALIDLLDNPRGAYALSRVLPDGERAPVERYLARLLEDRGQMSALAGLAARIGTLTDLGGPLRTSTTDATLDLHEISTTGGVASWCLNSMRSAVTAAQIGALALLDVQSVVARRLATGRHARPMLVLVDEFSALGSHHVLGLLARARACRVGVILGTQELADLARVDDAFADQVLGLCNTTLVMRQRVPESVERLAMLAGTTTTRKRTHQRVQGLVAARDTGVMAERDAEQFAVHPNQIRALRAGEGVLMRCDPQRLDRLRVTPRIAEPDTPATIADARSD